MRQIHWTKTSGNWKSARPPGGPNLRPQTCGGVFFGFGCFCFCDCSNFCFHSFMYLCCFFTVFCIMSVFALVSHRSAAPASDLARHFHSPLDRSKTANMRRSHCLTIRQQTVTNQQNAKNTQEQNKQEVNPVVCQESLSKIPPSRQRYEMNLMGFRKNVSCNLLAEEKDGCDVR